MKLLKYAFALMLSSTFINAQAANFETDIEKFSYSLGVVFGQNVMRQGVELDAPAFLQAIEDVLNRAETKMSSSQMQQTMRQYQKKEQEEQIARAGSNKEDGAKFLGENKKKDGVIELDSGLNIKS